MAIEFSERIRRIPVYPAAGGYAKQAELALLASNETPFPPLPAVREAIKAATGRLNRYPDPSNTALKTRLSERYDVPSSRIAIGNGSCDVLLAAGEALLGAGGRAGVRLALLLRLPAPRRRLRRAGRDRSRSTRPSATTWRRCSGRSPWRRAS